MKENRKVNLFRIGVVVVSLIGLLAYGASSDVMLPLIEKELIKEVEKTNDLSEPIADVIVKYSIFDR